MITAWLSYFPLWKWRIPADNTNILVLTVGGIWIKKNRQKIIIKRLLWFSAYNNTCFFRRNVAAILCIILDECWSLPTLNKNWLKYNISSTNTIGEVKKKLQRPAIMFHVPPQFSISTKHFCVSFFFHSGFRRNWKYWK